MSMPHLSATSDNEPYDHPMDAPSDQSGHLLTLINLALLTFADGVLINALPIVLGPTRPQTPGFWNLGTVVLIISTVSDVVGQMAIGSVIDLKGRSYATYLNCSGILLSSVCSLLASLARGKWLTLATLLAPLPKMLGGGSHATAFFSLVTLGDEASGSRRSALFYLTGAVIVVSQTVAAAVTPSLTKRTPLWPYLITIACCIIAYAVTAVHGSESDARPSIHPSAQPLLPRTFTDEPEEVSPQLGFFSQTQFLLGPTKGEIISSKRGVRVIVWVFFIAAIAKATRPLFTTYIQHRVAVSPQLAHKLWLGRTYLSLVLFVGILPLAVLSLPQSLSIEPYRVDLYAARIGIILIGTGAFLIGLSQSVPAIILALVINTLGVTTDLSLLAFVADSVGNDFSGRFFMLIASVESIGNLLGIGMLYPIYQLFLNDATFTGGIPYYICAGLYALISGILWSAKLIEH